MTLSALLMLAGVEALIPPRDEFGLPAPLWVFHVALPVSFALHAVFMNFTLGGALVVPILWFIGRRRAKPELAEMARTAMRVMPVAVSFTITTGVPLLLFVQAMYGHVFYTANILLGWQWLSLLAYLMVGFYLVYFAARLMDRGRDGPAYVVLVAVAVAFTMVAHVFNNNAVLSVRPELWEAMHAGRTGRHAADPMWIPRFLHTLIGSVAITGLWLAAIGRIRMSMSADARRASIVVGLRIALAATGLQALSGVMLLVSLDPSTQKALLTFGDVRSVGWALAAVGGILAIGLLWQCQQQPERARSVWLPVALIGFVLLGMSAGRELVRLEMLGRFPRALYTAADVRTQSGPIIVAVVTLVLGVAVIAWMLSWFARPDVRRGDPVPPSAPA